MSSWMPETLENIEPYAKQPLRFTGHIILTVLMHNVYFWAHHIWDNFIGADVLSRSSRTILITNIITAMVYWGTGFSFYWLDHRLATNKLPRWIAKYKLYTPYKEPTFAKMKSNLVTNGLHFFIFTAAILKMSNCISERDVDVSVWEDIFWVFVFLAIADVIFYSFHMMMHRFRDLYLWTHLQHHTTFGTTGFSSGYMHWLDFFLESILPTALPAVICGVHGPTLLVYFTMGSWNSVCVHAGWDFPLLPYPHTHFMHHRKYKVNYGLLLLDSIFQTKDESEGVHIYEVNADGKPLTEQNSKKAL